MDGGQTSQASDPAAASAAVAAAHPARLPLVVSVGFSGHRAFDDPAAIAAQIDRTLELLREALTALAERPLHGANERLAQAYDGGPRLRLITGDAPGGDGLMIERWRAAGLGETHLIYPFKDPRSGDALTDRPEHAAPEIRRTPPSDSPWTGLDPASLGVDPDQAHAEVTQWIIRHSEMLIAVWDGDQMTRPGGTGDTLRKALGRGLPVVWLQPGERRIRLADPALTHRRGGVPESAEALEGISADLTAEGLADLLAPAIAPPGAMRRHARDPEVVGRQDYTHVDPLRPWRQPFRAVQTLCDRTLWRTFRLFESVLGGSDARQSPHRGPAVPATIAEQPGFIYLRAALSEAAARASQLSSIHRSQQLLLIMLATVAVFFGALPALLQADTSQTAKPAASAAPARAPNARQRADGLHAGAAGAELVLVVSAVGIAFLAGRYHRHRRWSDARRLAERLRAARATWPLGIDISDARLTPPRSWTEWRAEAVLRAAGPRRGWLDGESFQETATWVTADLLDGQAIYHERQFRLSARIARAIRWTERIAFFTLMATLAGFIIGYWVTRVEGWTLPVRLSGFVTVISAVCPALGAACLALEATSGFGELELRSERLEHDFRGFREQLEEDGGMTYHHTQDVIRRGAQLLVEESGAWRDQVARRRLVQAG